MKASLANIREGEFLTSTLDGILAIMVCSLSRLAVHFVDHGGAPDDIQNGDIARGQNISTPQLPIARMKRPSGRLTDRPGGFASTFAVRNSKAQRSRFRMHSPI